MGGTRIFWDGQKGGTSFFSGQRGDQFFFYVCKGGGDQNKLATGHHKQTPPLPVKNDSSLNFIQLGYILTLRLLHTAENNCPAMSQRATVELRVLHIGLLHSTSLNVQFLQR